MNRPGIGGTSRVIATLMLTALAALTSLLALMAGAPPARATAYGSTPVNSFGYSYQGLSLRVPIGCFRTHVVRGDRTVIAAERAGVDCAGAGVWGGGFCNTRIDFAYDDTDNRRYLVDTGATDNRCRHDLLRDGPRRVLPSYGKACAVLYVDGVARARQCHSISA